ncbi:MAG TPA: DoxX family protein, partial [Vicinamibacteria bacterium]
AFMKLRPSPEVVEVFGGKFGYPQTSFLPIGLLEAACAVLYAIPQTAVLGAVLVTGYLGGAVATHVRVGDAFLSPVVLGAIAWAGLYLREPRLWPLLPLRRSTPD